MDDPNFHTAKISKIRTSYLALMTSVGESAVYRVNRKARAKPVVCEAPVSFVLTYCGRLVR